MQMPEPVGRFLITAGLWKSDPISRKRLESVENAPLLSQDYSAKVAPIQIDDPRVISPAMSLQSRGD